MALASVLFQVFLNDGEFWWIWFKRSYYLINKGCIELAVAALSYFSGNCSLKNQIRYEFYGDNVMAITKRYESDIAALKAN